MKKKIILTTTLIIISSLIILLSYKKEDNITFLGAVNNKSNLLSIMLETSSGSYEASSQDTFPTTGYVFNSTLSGCENGGELSYDSDNKKVIMEGNSVDKCYAYFDIYTPTLAETITKLYTGVQGENGLYYHDSSLTNGANDNSYRYAGASDSVNNYVCFGSDESTCPHENIYQVIGVFDNKVKLIKYDYALSSLLGTDGDYYGTYEKTGFSGGSNGGNSISDIATYNWNYNNDTSANSGRGSNDWTTSLLNKVNLNTNFLNNIGNKWSNMISTTAWIISGYDYNNVTSKEIYTKEITNATKTYNAKIGLMYASDYGYAASSSVWNNSLDRYETTIIGETNWMYMGLIESTISRSTTNNYYSNYIHFGGGSGSGSVNVGHAIRPTFYLNSNVTKTSGDGTKTNPYRISN